ncbi:rhodanese-like domain-containing protein [Rhizobium leguminosarum]|uniref:rhodanese-like domain-containing protein n=1 Tax=Rhizobium leguminosarum TaxID=384 RepID=UPI001C92221B|nr:rhodanese-like domain-containing protein [Rhizobium leguminosarum]MBY2985487.1 rhodanese-like domain-containing protein [Rhizobium leguminosarum]
MLSPVSQIPAAAPDAAVAHFAAKLAFETDCSDVHATFAAGKVDFVLLDVRSPQLFAESHIPGAINLPHGKMTAHRMSTWASDALFVVYCAGPHCNGADKAAFRLANLGLQVKLMIGGMTGWADEGFTFEQRVPAAA